MQLTFPSALTPASPRSRQALLPWLAGLLIVLLVSTALRAETYTLPGTNITLTYSLSGSPAKATITDCNTDAAGALAIPDTLGGVPVTSIDSAFHDCMNLTSVIIPNSITSIGTRAFEYCYRLTSVTIPNSVTSIGTYVFLDCRSLTSITIPNSVTSIALATFSDCTSLTSVTIPNSITSIGDYAFRSCTNLSSVTIPNSVTSISYSAFYDCRSLTSVTIPNSITSIGDYAFSACTSLSSVTFTGNTPASPWFGGNVFDYAAPGFTIYYPPWASGFSTPTWQGYPAKPTIFYADTTYAVGGGWKWNGLGFFYDGFYPFLWLPQGEKWLYLSGTDEDSFFFFDFTRNYWGWTARAYYPQGVMLDGPENGVWVEL